MNIQPAQEIDIPPQSYPDIFLRFLKFGLLAWGGPFAQIAMIRQELVEEEKWISPERFNRVLSVYQALPGPEAHELCVYFGMIAGGRIGALLAGLGFMLPGFFLALGNSSAWGACSIAESQFSIDSSHRGCCLCARSTQTTDAGNSCCNRILKLGCV